MSIYSLRGNLGRYELVDPTRNHNKFWECRPSDAFPNLYTVRYGRITDNINGKGQKKDGLSYEQAMNAINEKLGKGYRLVEASDLSMNSWLASKLQNRLDDEVPQVTVPPAPTRSMRL